jgi:hypothetical protein
VVLVVHLSVVLVRLVLPLVALLLPTLVRAVAVVAHRVVQAVVALFMSGGQYERTVFCTSC